MQNDETIGTYEQAEAKRDIAPGFRRGPIIAGHDRTASTTLLGNPLGKLGRGNRKMLLHLRSNRIRPIEPVVAVASSVKFARKLMSLKLTQLVRRQKKFAREASTAKHLIAKMSPTGLEGPSRLKSQMQNRHEESLAAFGQVTAEIRARALACEGRLAEAE